MTKYNVILSVSIEKDISSGNPDEAIASAQGDLSAFENVHTISCEEVEE